MGLATSPDGITWEFYNDPATPDEGHDQSDPVLAKGSASSWEKNGAATFQVRCTESGFEMFYIGFRTDPINSFGAEGSHKLGYANSADGIHWTRSEQNPIFNTLDPIWPAIGVAIVDDLYNIYYDLSGGASGIGLITGTISGS